MILVMLSNTLFRFEVHCNKKYIKTSRQRQKVKTFKKHFLYPYDKSENFFCYIESKLLIF